jgi:hypothetical protein
MPAFKIDMRWFSDKTSKTWSILLRNGVEGQRFFAATHENPACDAWILRMLTDGSKKTPSGLRRKEFFSFSFLPCFD